MRRVVRLDGGNGVLFFGAGSDEDGRGLVEVTVVSGYRALGVVVRFEELVSAIGELVRESPGLLQAKRAACDWYGVCRGPSVPDTKLVKKLVDIAAEGLKEVPEPIKGEEWLWSPEEAEAARVAATLLRLASTVLEDYNVAKKLSRVLDSIKDAVGDKT